MDYRKFLGKSESMVLPYFGGGFVDAPTRRLRVGAPAPGGPRELGPGWWQFEVTGRVAVPRGRAAAEGLDALPLVRGPFVSGWVVSGGAAFERVLLLPDEEPPVLTPCRARRWHSGDLVFDGLDFEGEVEEAVRRALDDGAAIDGVPGVGAPLRAAFGLAVLLATAQARRVQLSPHEALAHVLGVAAGGRRAAETVLVRLDAERHEGVLRNAARTMARRAVALPVRSSEGRAEAALVAAQARMRRVRRLGEGHLEVSFDFMGETFVTVVVEDTLQVVDAGICLAGADEEVTLESLPSVIREAIQTSRLVITRR